MMSGNDLAKELIRRRVHPPPPPRRPPRLRPASPVGNATTTSSYEMVEQPQENQHSPTLADNEEHRRFWRLRRRPQSHAPLGLGKEEQDGGIERRVVSEPTEQRRGVFNRLRLRRASEAGQQEDRNVTFVSETVRLLPWSDYIRKPSRLSSRRTRSIRMVPRPLLMQ